MDADTISKIFTIVLIVCIVILPSFVVFVIDLKEDKQRNDDRLDEL